MPSPDFVIGGVQNGGTTSLFHYVRKHPEVWMSPVKEIQFFNHNYHLGLAWYADHFVGHGDEPAIGEASPG